MAYVTSKVSCYSNSMLVQINKRSKLMKIWAKLFEVASERIEHKIAFLGNKQSIVAIGCTSLMLSCGRCCVACMTAQVVLLLLSAAIIASAQPDTRQTRSAAPFGSYLGCFDLARMLYLPGVEQQQVLTAESGVLV